MALFLGFAFTLVMSISESMADQKDIVYIEASTANRWKLGEFGSRVNDSRYKIETITEYDFDKSKHIDRVISGRGRQPDAVVVQECSVYFPGDLQAYKEKYRSWIRQIKQAGLTPVIATSVPPAHSLGFKEDLKTFIKEKILGREGQYDQVVAFNEWLRELARAENVALLDLESATRISEADRHMRKDYDAGDGIHLNRGAYDTLDKELLSTLRKVVP